MSGQTAAGGGATDITSQLQVRLLKTKNSHICTSFNCSDLYMPLKVCAGPWGSVQVAEGLKRSCRSQTRRHKKTDTLECDVTSCNYHHRTTEKMQNTLLRMSLSFLQYLSPTNTVCFHSNTANSWFSSLSINKIKFYLSSQFTNNIVSLHWTCVYSWSQQGCSLCQPTSGKRTVGPHVFSLWFWNSCHLVWGENWAEKLVSELVHLCVRYWVGKCQNFGSVILHISCFSEPPRSLTHLWHQQSLAINLTLASWQA